MVIDAATLALAMGQLPMSRAQIWAPCYDEAMHVAQIDSRERAADFIAQTGHESLSLYYGNEVWGPTPAQETYERDFKQPWGPGLVRGNRNFKAWTLGNAFAGDGRKFAGHGPIQTTGRSNHAKARDELRVLMGPTVPDFCEHPEEAAKPRWGSLMAAMFWKRNDLNRFSDLDTVAAFTDQTRRINGGVNGLDDRLARRRRARRALGLAEV